MLVLLGWFGLFEFHFSASGSGQLAFLLLFLGMLFADLLHCVLEFSIFPLLLATVPYATPALAEATYHSTPFAAIQSVGQLLVLAGVPLTVLSILQCSRLPRWAALPFVLTAALMLATLISALRAAVQPYSLASLYLSMSILGTTLFRITG
jgi:hypothetical protein